MLYLWLADSVGAYGAVHVDCGAVLLSQNGLPDSILNAADIRMLTMSMPESSGRMLSLKHCSMHLH